MFVLCKLNWICKATAVLAASILLVAHWSHSATYVSEPPSRHAGSLADSQGTESDMEFLNDCTHWQAASSKWGSLSSSPVGSHKARRSWLETGSCLTSLQREEQRRSSDVLHVEEKPALLPKGSCGFGKVSCLQPYLSSLLPADITPANKHLFFIWVSYWLSKSWVVMANTCPLWCDPVPSHMCRVSSGSWPICWTDCLLLLTQDSLSTHKVRNE